MSEFSQDEPAGAEHAQPPDDQRPQNAAPKGPPKESEAVIKCRKEVERCEKALAEWNRGTEQARRNLGTANDRVADAARLAQIEAESNARRVAAAPRGRPVRLATDKAEALQDRLREQKDCRRELAKCVRGSSVASTKLKAAKKALEKAIASDKASAGAESERAAKPDAGGGTKESE